MPCCLLHHLPDEMLCPNIFIQLQMLINMEAITANVTSENAVINTGHMDHALTIRINSTRVNTAAYTAVTCCNNTTVSVYHDCVMSLNVFTRLISKCTTESNVAHFIFHFFSPFAPVTEHNEGEAYNFFFFFSNFSAANLHMDLCLLLSGVCIHRRLLQVCTRKHDGARRVWS